MESTDNAVSADLFTGLRASFEDILGKTAKTFPESVRLSPLGRMAADRATLGTGGPGHGQELDIPRVPRGCKHRNGAWCDLQGIALYRQSDSLVQARYSGHGLHGFRDGTRLTNANSRGWRSTIIVSALVAIRAHAHRPAEP
jgi:hypothetical protein